MRWRVEGSTATYGRFAKSGNPITPIPLFSRRARLRKDPGDCARTDSTDVSLRRAGCCASNHAPIRRDGQDGDSLVGDLGDGLARSPFRETSYSAI